MHGEIGAHGHAAGGDQGGQDSAHERGAGVGGPEGQERGRAVLHELAQDLLDVCGGEVLATEGCKRRGGVGGAVDAVQGAADQQAQRRGGDGAGAPVAGAVERGDLRGGVVVAVAPRRGWGARFARAVAGAVERVGFGGCFRRGGGGGAVLGGQVSLSGGGCQYPLAQPVIASVGFGGESGHFL